VSGRLAVVGIGPGSPDLLTREAARELAAAEVLVGYAGYLDLLPVEVAPGRREPSPLGVERERAQRALAAAAGGAQVALVSGGDAGIYGMASLALDEAAALGEGAPPLVVVPGVTAASAAAALLGAPLAVDFACLSLSDLLVPRAEVLDRLRALAAADITLVLYNPASRTRREPWLAAVAELQRRRDGATPVAAVRRAYREGQEVVISRLDRLGELAVDMETVVLVGSSRTRRHGGWLYALREEPGSFSNRLKS
jgi:precorrin-3B C17-methyltransferase